MAQKNNPISATALRVLGPRTALELVSTVPANLPDGALCWVTDSGGIYRYSRTSTAAISLDALPAGNLAGTYGRWLRLAGSGDRSFAECLGIINNGNGISFTVNPVNTYPSGLAGVGLSVQHTSDWAQAGAANSPNFTYTGTPRSFALSVGVAATAVGGAADVISVVRRQQGSGSVEIDMSYMSLTAAPGPFPFYSMERMIELEPNDEVNLGFRAAGVAPVDVLVNQLYFNFKAM